MLKKTLLRSLNILKISTWVTAFMALAVLAVVAFLIMFPQTIKGQIESRLSEISGLDVRIEKISLEFQENELFLAVKELQISSDSLKPIAKVDVLRWNVDLMALYKGIEIPGHIDVNELLIDTSNIDDYVGIMNAVNLSSVTDGFLKNDVIRLPFPPDAIKVREKAINFGLSKQVTTFEETLNRAAEEATKKALPIFINAIKNMSVSDGFSILKGGDGAATKFLKRQNSDKQTNFLSRNARPLTYSRLNTQPLAYFNRIDRSLAYSSRSARPPSLS